MPYNLNAISHDAAIALVRLVLGDGVNVQQVGSSGALSVHVCACV